MYTVTYRGGVKGIDGFITSDGQRFRRGTPVSGVSEETKKELEAATHHRFEIEKGDAPAKPATTPKAGEKEGSS